MYYRNQSTARRLVLSSEAIAIVQSDPEINETMARFGVTVEDLAAGYGFFLNAKQALDASKAALGEQILATNALNETYRSMRTVFVGDRRFVRLIFRDQPEAHERYGARGVVKRVREEFVQQVRFFYDAVLADEELLAALMEQYNVSRELLERHQQGIADLEAAMQLQQDRQGITRDLIRTRREAMAELDAWMGRFIGIARQAFRDESAKLIRLGIKVQ